VFRYLKTLRAVKYVFSWCVFRHFSERIHTREYKLARLFLLDTGTTIKI
jgi:hypothetical protein